MKVLTVLIPALLLAASVQPMLADNDSTQQEKDFENKQRIYGTKHPWENTAPYGTQYTPPQAGVGSSSESESEPPKKAAPTKTSAKHLVHKKTKKPGKTTKPAAQPAKAK